MWIVSISGEEPYTMPDDSGARSRLKHHINHFTRIGARFEVYSDTGEVLFSNKTGKEITEDDLLSICIAWEKNKEEAIDMLHEFKPVYSREELTIFISKIYSELM